MHDPSSSQCLLFFIHLSSLLPSLVLLCLPVYYHSTNEEQKAVAQYVAKVHCRERVFPLLDRHIGRLYVLNEEK